MKKTYKDRKKFWLTWIHAAACDIETGKCPQEIVDHIRKHFTDDVKRHLHEEERIMPSREEIQKAKDQGKEGILLSKSRSDIWDKWFASAYNLLAMFQIIIKLGEYRKPSEFLEEMLHRLDEKYKSNPDTHTPPPGTKKKVKKSK